MVRPRQFDDADVLNRAMHVFWRNGYKGTSVQDLVDATGLLRGSLYGAFGDKHALFLAALDTYCEQMLQQLRALLEDAEDPVQGLRTFIQSGGGDCKNRASAKRGCLVGNTCSELVPHDVSTRRRVEGFVGEMRRTMAEALRRAQVMGTFGAERDPDAVATFVQCSLQGLALLAKSRPKDAVIDGVVEEILRVLDCPTLGNRDRHKKDSHTGERHEQG